MRRVAIVCVIVLGLAASPARAAWNSQGSSSGYTKAKTMPAGNQPTVSVSNRNVAVSWTASTFSGGGAVSGYSVKRYDANGNAQSIGSACSGTVSALTCTESAVPAGTWKYSVTPKQGTSWSGQESAQSASATVQSPNLTFTSSTTVTTLPTTLSGNISNYVSGQTVSFKLDNPSTGTTLTGTLTPSPVPSSGAAAVTVTIPSGTSNGTHTVYAIGSGGDQASAGITVNVSTCPSAAPNLTWLSGLESAYSTTAGGGMWNVSTGTASLSTTTVRSGAESLQIAPAGAAVQRGRALNATGNPMVLRFAVRLASLPVADSELAGLLDSAHLSTPPYFTLKYIAATQKLAIGYPGQTVSSSSTIQAGNWYTIDIRFNPTTNPKTADWRIDGVSQPSTSYAEAASYAYEWYLGSSTAAIYTANYDDIATSETASDYPIGPGKVLALVPDGMGTNVGATNLQNDDGTALNSTSWQRLDEIPMNSGTDYIKQVTASTTSYAELSFANTTETCISAVGGRVTFDPQNSNQDDYGETRIQDGSTARTLYAGTMTATATAFSPKYATIAPTGSAWTPTELNGLTARIGYSNDVAPIPRWEALMLEYNVPQ